MCSGGKLSYIGDAEDKPMHILNNKTGSQRSPNRRRTIFKGFYEFDIEVAIQKIENKVSTKERRKSSSMAEKLIENHIIRK